MAYDNENSSSGLSSSLADLMTSLAVIFILLLVGMLHNAIQQAEGRRNQVLTMLQKALEEFRAKGVEVRTDPKDPLNLLVVVPEELLKFERGDSQVPAAGRAFLDSFIPRFVGTACSEELRSGISSVVVEGHASSEGSESGNLRLSQARSMAVVQKSIEVVDSSGAAESQEEHRCLVQLVSATGRGSAEPVLSNGSEDRQASRRVIFKIRVKSLEQQGFEGGSELTSSKSVNH